MYQNPFIPPPAHRSLADRIEDVLPQTQCTKCGYPACRPYAEAIADGHANFNQCPPGGMEGIIRLASLLGRPVVPLNPVNGTERPRPVAIIDEALCIGCTLCIQACPVDAIVGAPRQIHTVLADLCTGCDLCVAPCPVDCIAMMDDVAPGKTGWDAWSQQQADAARKRHDRRAHRLLREEQENNERLAIKAAEKLKEVLAVEAKILPEKAEQQRKKDIIQEAIERARSRNEKMPARRASGGSDLNAATASAQFLSGDANAGPAQQAGAKEKHER
jgi:electron transport complex protein RnfB